MCSAGATRLVAARDQHCAPGCASRDVDPVAPVRRSLSLSASDPARRLSRLRACRRAPGAETSAQTDTVSASDSCTCRGTRRATPSRTLSCTRHRSPCDNPPSLSPLQTSVDVAPAATTGVAVARHWSHHRCMQFWAK